MSKRFGRRGLLGLFAGMAAAAKVAPIAPPPVVAKPVIRSSWYACTGTFMQSELDDDLEVWVQLQRNEAIVEYNRAVRINMPRTEAE